MHQFGAEHVATEVFEARNQNSDRVKLRQGINGPCVAVAITLRGLPLGSQLRPYC
jgi:hypothetical protein